MRSAPSWAIAIVVNIVVVSTSYGLEAGPSMTCLADVTNISRSNLEPSHTRFLVLDLSPPEGTTQIANRIFSFASVDADPVVHALHGSLHAMRMSPLDSAKRAEAVVNLLRKCADHLAKRSSNRWISSQGDSVEIYLLRSANRAATIDITEEARQTRLSADLVTLVQLAQKIVFGMMDADKVKYSFTFSEYYLTKVRANLKVAGSLLPVAQTPAVATKADAPAQLNTSLITGPREHFFLSANAAFTNTHQIKYDEKTKSLEPATKPKQFLVAMNYTYGDVFDDAKQSALRSFLEGLYVGLAVEGSTNPFNQVALTLGFRHLPGVENFVSFDTVSPYVGYVLVRNARIAGTVASPGVEGKYAKKSLVLGLSLNLNKALAWVGK